jgi:transposase
MTRALSPDLRDRVVAAIRKGASCRQVAAAYSVSVASAVRWSQLARETGSTAPRPHEPRRRPVLLAERDWLLARVAAAPELTVRALQAELAERRGVQVGYGAVWRFLAREGLTFKKSLRAAEQHRPDVAYRRQRWRRHQGRIDPKRLVFVDETSAKTNMTRSHGRAPRGQRLVGRVPHGHWKTMTFLAALRSDRIDAPCVTDGPINGALFLAWVQQFLVPTLKPGDIVVLEPKATRSGTTSAATRASPCAVPSAPPAPTCSSCRPTAPT